MEIILVELYAITRIHAIIISYVFGRKYNIIETSRRGCNKNIYYRTSEIRNIYCNDVFFLFNKHFFRKHSQNVSE